MYAGYKCDLQRMQPSISETACMIVTHVNEHQLASGFGHLTPISQKPVKIGAKILQCELGISDRKIPVSHYNIKIK